jgi:hypothetical protein
MLRSCGPLPAPVRPALAREGRGRRGQAERADPGLLPDFSFLEDSQRYTSIHGYLPVAGNYQLVVDNLLD